MTPPRRPISSVLPDAHELVAVGWDTRYSRAVADRLWLGPEFATNLRSLRGESPGTGRTTRDSAVAKRWSSVVTENASESCIIYEYVNKYWIIEESHQLWSEDEARRKELH